MFNLNPKEDKFFVLFVDEAKNIHEAAKLLKKGFVELQTKEECSKEIGHLEHKGDKMVHDSIVELDNAFITPLDREDIYSLIKKMDNILDLIDSAGSRLIMYDLVEVKKEATVMCDMIVEATEEVVLLMEELKKIGKKNNKIIEKIKKINSIEHKGDLLYRENIRDLFKSGDDVLDIIKWQDVLVLLENTLDACEQIATIVEGVVMKNA
ncbi:MULTISPECIES: DUF47 domain-containing protein [Clostridium]|uniref:DUF47 domain-containing protein n=1 Tax=Clostridium nitritogenes TaxID=83340 RepID=A0ABN1LIS0_9CLOT|nr:DUF47 family protein [Clostridium baratii]AQM59330.1 phosphate transport regulator [Clostridium baratii]KJU70663.1 phosphate transport regulator [Clostridium baratii]MBS6043703.1 DUF47 domain-containing protein [Clostridium baratii]MBT9832973.1 DUF47 family protein [Clostridium baratii]MDY3207613.1 DUF47 family protein [Clostridium baratii]